MYRPSSEQVLAEREHGHGHAKSAVADGGEITASETSPGVSPGRWVGSTEPPALPLRFLPSRPAAAAPRCGGGPIGSRSRPAADALGGRCLLVCVACLLALRGRFRPSSGLASGR
jgi:hypothetical protein